MIVEMLAGPLVKAAYVEPSLDGEWGSTFIAIDPELLVDIAEFKTQCSDMLQKIKQSRKKAGAQEIRLPGEKSQWLHREAKASGFVDIDDSVLEKLGYL
jgi:LDH2 family malate/lactate/ureidoglycolate dehydrogenase